MKRILAKLSAILGICLLLTACASTDGFSVSMPSMQQAEYLYHHQMYKQAINALTLLANYGRADAQYALGYMYYQGLGTQKNAALARGWFERSAKQGYPKAIKALRMITLKRQDVY